MSISRHCAHWGLHTRNWLLVNCDRQCLDRVSTLAADALQGRNKVTYTPFKDFGDYVVLYNTRRISLEGNMWEEHTYHFKSDYSHRKLALFQRTKGRRVSKDARLNRNMFFTAEEAHNIDPTYVVRAAIHAKLLGKQGSDRDASFGRCFTFADRNVPQDILENISEIPDLPPVSKKLSEYSEAERNAFPRLLEESGDMTIYEQDDIDEKYFWDRTKPEKMGPVGSRQELEFKKSLNLAEFIAKPGKKLSRHVVASGQTKKFK